MHVQANLLEEAVSRRAMPCAHCFSLASAEAAVTLPSQGVVVDEATPSSSPMIAATEGLQRRRRATWLPSGPSRRHAGDDITEQSATLNHPIDLRRMGSNPAAGEQQRGLQASGHQHLDPGLTIRLCQTGVCERLDGNIWCSLLQPGPVHTLCTACFADPAVDCRQRHSQLVCCMLQPTVAALSVLLPRRMSRSS